MSLRRSVELSNLLNALRNGDSTAYDTFIALLYNQLRALAYRGTPSGHLSKTEPTHVAWQVCTRFIDEAHLSASDRKDLYLIAARALRQLLVEQSQRHESQGGDSRLIGLEAALEPPAVQDLDLVLLDQALNRLETLDAPKAKIVELRFFTGLSNQEIGRLLGLSKESVEREWTVAKAWIIKELKGASA
jgi:RNA polymerase sigma factor (TIGR02999 family)